MIWSAFNTEVRKHLTAYNRVQGIQTWMDLLIKAGAADVQRAVEFYQTGNTSTFTAAQLTADGYAQTGVMPAGTISAARIQGATESNPVFQASWALMRDMREGTLSANPIIAVDATGRKFALYPALNSESSLVLEWTGVKYEYADADTVPFDAAFVQAVAEYVMARCVRQVDHDVGLSQSYLASFALLKRQLVSETRAARTLK